jgi:hypothetical protein
MSLEPDLETNAAFSVEKQGGSVLFRLAASSRNHLVIDLARKQRHRFPPFLQKTRKWVGHPDRISLPDQ